jgi:hypothetical protein
MMADVTWLVAGISSARAGWGKERTARNTKTAREIKGFMM